MHTFELKSDEEYIELNNLLKVLGWVSTGGEAKIRIKSEEIRVNGDVELRVRRKMRAGDVVQWENRQAEVHTYEGK